MITANRRRAELRDRIARLRDLRQAVNDELTVLEAELLGIDPTAPIGTRRSRHDKPDCGTESGYHWHRWQKRAGKSDDNPCDACKRAHSTHEKVAAARRRLDARKEQAA